ncbi:hypothetical protein BY996DRAFT_8540468 [Phakopsora pachyrhizi]|nr:hypothetical protein BY996DRAFT_8540468 [Phakopsora pachyrhizi]
MPVVYAIISFFSYRFFCSYMYYSLVRTVYEAFAIAAFLFPLVQYIGKTSASQRAILDQSPAIICHSRDVLCLTQYSIHFAQAYLKAFDFITFSLALYGLIGFYNVTRVQLKGKSPLAKFLTINDFHYVMLI